MFGLEILSWLFEILSACIEPKFSLRTMEPPTVYFEQHEFLFRFVQSMKKLASVTSFSPEYNFQLKETSLYARRCVKEQISPSKFQEKKFKNTSTTSLSHYFVKLLFVGVFFSCRRIIEFIFWLCLDWNSFGVDHRQRQNSINRVTMYVDDSETCSMRFNKFAEARTHRFGFHDIRVEKQK